MTLEYVARTYRVSEAALAERLGVPPDVDPKTTLKSLAEKQGLSPFRYIEQVQQAISELRSTSSPPGRRKRSARRIHLVTRSSLHYSSTVIPFWG